MLQSLIHPHAPDRFLRELLGRQPLVGNPTLDLFWVLSELPQLQGIEELLEGAPGSVTSWRPDHWIPRQSRVDGQQALSEYGLGASLYFTKLERHIPRLLQFCCALERDLSVPRGSVSVQAFAARAGYGVPLHYDHDDNLNLQLKGDKVWWMGPAPAIVNPLQGEFRGHVPPGSPTTGTVGDVQLEVSRAVPGTLHYVPRGCWHATRCESDSLAISFALAPPMVLDVLLDHLRVGLLQVDQARTYAYGVLQGEPPEPVRAALEACWDSLAAFQPLEGRFPARRGSSSPHPTPHWTWQFSQSWRDAGQEDLLASGEWPMVCGDGRVRPAVLDPAWAQAFARLHRQAPPISPGAELARSLGCNVGDLGSFLRGLESAGILTRVPTRRTVPEPTA